MYSSWCIGCNTGEYSTLDNRSFTPLMAIDVGVSAYSINYGTVPMQLVCYCSYYSLFGRVLVVCYSVCFSFLYFFLSVVRSRCTGHTRQSGGLVPSRHYLTVLSLLSSL